MVLSTKSIGSLGQNTTFFAYPLPDMEKYAQKLNFFFQIIPSKLLSVCTEFDNLSLKTSRNYFFLYYVCFQTFWWLFDRIEAKNKKWYFFPKIVARPQTLPTPHPICGTIPFVVPSHLWYPPPKTTTFFLTSPLRNCQSLYPSFILISVFTPTPSLALLQSNSLNQFPPTQRLV